MLKADSGAPLLLCACVPVSLSPSVREKQRWAALLCDMSDDANRASVWADIKCAGTHPSPSPPRPRILKRMHTSFCCTRLLQVPRCLTDCPGSSRLLFVQASERSPFGESRPWLYPSHQLGFGEYATPVLFTIRHPRTPSPSPSPSFLPAQAVSAFLHRHLVMSDGV